MLRKAKDEPSFFGRLHCSFGCRKNCKHENVAYVRGTPAIQGLHSNWVAGEVVAMQRPSERLIKLHNVIEQFRQQRIQAVVNLQQAGEHPFCGDGIMLQSGFSYLPETFMDAGIHYYNFPWHDMGVPSLSLVLHIVQTIAGVTRKGGRVAIHCHAGLGRTGLIIACYLVYARNMPAIQAVHAVRADRPRALQTKGQVRCVVEFALYLERIRTCYVVLLPELLHGRFPQRLLSLNLLTEAQAVYLPGSEWRQLLWTPRPIHEVITMACHLAESRPSRFPPEEVLRDFAYECSVFRLDPLAEHIKYALNQDSWALLYDEDGAHPRVLGRLFVDFFLQLDDPLIDATVTAEAFESWERSQANPSSLSPGQRTGQSKTEEALLRLFPRQVRHILRCVSRLCCFESVSNEALADFALRIAELFLGIPRSLNGFTQQFHQVLNTPPNKNLQMQALALSVPSQSGTMNSASQTSTRPAMRLSASERGVPSPPKDLSASPYAQPVTSPYRNVLHHRHSYHGSRKPRHGLDEDEEEGPLSRHGMPHENRNVALYATMRRWNPNVFNEDLRKNSSARKRIGLDAIGFVPDSTKASSSDAPVEKPQRDLSASPGPSLSRASSSDERRAVLSKVSRFLLDYFAERRRLYLAQNVAILASATENSSEVKAKIDGSFVPVIVPKDDEAEAMPLLMSSSEAAHEQKVAHVSSPVRDVDGQALTAQASTSHPTSPNDGASSSPIPASASDKSPLSANGYSPQPEALPSMEESLSPHAFSHTQASPLDDERLASRSLHLDIGSISQMLDDNTVTSPADTADQGQSSTDQVGDEQLLSNDHLQSILSPKQSPRPLYADESLDDNEQLRLMREQQDELEEQSEMQRGREERPGTASMHIRQHRAQELEKEALRQRISPVTIPAEIVAAEEEAALTADDGDNDSVYSDTQLDVYDDEDEDEEGHRIGETGPAAAHSQGNSMIAVPDAESSPSVAQETLIHPPMDDGVVLAHLGSELSIPIVHVRKSSDLQSEILDEEFSGDGVVLGSVSKRGVAHSRQNSDLRSEMLDDHGYDLGTDDDEPHGSSVPSQRSPHAFRVESPSHVDSPSMLLMDASLLEHSTAVVQEVSICKFDGDHSPILFATKSPSSSRDQSREPSYRDVLLGELPQPMNAEDIDDSLPLTHGNNEEKHSILAIVATQDPQVSNTVSDVDPSLNREEGDHHDGSFPCEDVSAKEDS